MTKILFVEDNKQYKEQICAILGESGYEIVAVENPIDALEIFQSGVFDLVISDFVLGSMNGIQLIKYLKKLDPNIRTIILTGVDSPDVELSALDNSIDQFLHKGVTSEVLQKYINRVLQAPIKNFVENDGNLKQLQSLKEHIVVDLENYEVTQKGEIVELTYKEFQLLVFFMKNMGKVLRREEILDNLWEESKDEITMRVVDTHVKLLRKKLNLRVIQTIRNVGYRWNE